MANYVRPQLNKKWQSSFALFNERYVDPHPAETIAGVDYNTAAVAVNTTMNVMRMTDVDQLLQLGEIGLDDVGGDITITAIHYAKNGVLNVVVPQPEEITVEQEARHHGDTIYTVTTELGVMEVRFAKFSGEFTASTSNPDVVGLMIIVERKNWSRDGDPNVIYNADLTALEVANG